jgi:erythromycin esterase-like protein
MLNTERQLALALSIAILGGCSTSAANEGHHRVLQRAVEESRQRIAWDGERVTNLASLSRFLEAVGTARVVLIGEATHGDGTAVALRGELTQVLYSEKGFRVLATESPWLEAERADHRLTAGETSRDSVELGFHPVWRGTRELQRTLEFIAETAGSDRPMQIVGLDPQPLRGSEGNVASQVRRELDQGTKYADHQHDKVQRSLTSLLSGCTSGDASALSTQAAIRRMIDDAARSPNSRRLRWRAVPAASAYLDQCHLMYVAHDPTAASERRDREMANSLLTILRQSPRARVVVWLASLHAAKSFRSLVVDSAPELASYRSVGAVLTDSLGDDVKAFAITAAQGVSGGPGRQTFHIPIASRNSAEGAVEQLHDSVSFVDLRQLERRFPKPYGLKALGYAEMRGRWAYAFNGAFVVRSMSPLTMVQRSACNPLSPSTCAAAPR